MGDPCKALKYTRDLRNEIMQPDGKTVKKVMINEAALLKTVSNLKVTPERLWPPNETSTASRERVENEEREVHTKTRIMAITQNTGCTR